MAFLLTRIDQVVDVIWTGDPDVRRTKKDADTTKIIEADRAKVRKSGAVDVFTVRPLNNREVLSLGAYAGSDPGLAVAAVEMCWLACTKIARADGTTTEDPAEIRRVIDEEAPPDFVSDLSSFVYDLTLGGGQKKT